MNLCCIICSVLISDTCGSISGWLVICKLCGSILSGETSRMIVYRFWVNRNNITFNCVGSESEVFRWNLVSVELCLLLKGSEFRLPDPPCFLSWPSVLWCRSHHPLGLVKLLHCFMTWGLDSQGHYPFCAFVTGQDIMWQKLQSGTDHDWGLIECCDIMDCTGTWNTVNPHLCCQNVTSVMLDQRQGHMISFLTFMYFFSPSSLALFRNKKMS